MEATREKLSSRTENAYFEVGRYFLKLGFLGFGGPLALMAAFQRDLVENRKWVSTERFAQALALIKALPGPVASQLAIYLGSTRAGRLGGLIAGVCLVLPSFVMMVALAAFYSTLRKSGWSEPLLFGMQSAALGVIAESVWRLGAPYRKELAFWILALGSAAITVWKPSFEPIVIIGAGILGMVLLWMRNKPVGTSLSVPILGATGIIGLSSTTTSAAATAYAGTSSGVLMKLAGVSLKAGALVFGTGLAIVPLLAQDVVHANRWLTENQFMDALAFGQITPGPVIITTTFIGYKIAGLTGALVATVGVFAPSFFNMLTWFPVAERKLGQSPYTRRFAFFAISAVVGAIAAAVGKLALATPHGGTPLSSWLIAFVALLIALKTRIPVWITIPGAGLATMLYSFI